MVSQVFFFQTESTDIGFQNFIVMPERFKWIGYLVPYEGERICFMGPKPASEANWKQYFKIFDEGS